MAEKVKEPEMKKASKARNREGEKGQWWPCDVTDFKLKAFQKEGLIALGSYMFTKDSSTPVPETNERVLTKAWVERGLSLPPLEFYLEVLSTYGL
jgi:GMP synthase-like glutamine amidotransferase